MEPNIQKQKQANHWLPGEMKKEGVGVQDKKGWKAERYEETFKE